MSTQVEAARITGPVVSWTRVPDALVLERDEVHVWRAALDIRPSQWHALFQTLSQDERTRSARFRFQKDRKRFVARRGLLRSILRRYLDVEPCQLRFSYGAYGKPALAGEFGSEGLRFNMSHSDGVALYAVSRDREVGIDIERIRLDFADIQIAEQFFSPREIAVLRALPAQMQKEAFFTCWTRKEAYIKATGNGLSLPLDTFDVSCAPGEPAALLNTRGDPKEASRWALQGLSPGACYVAALAVEGHSWRLTCWQW